MTALRQNQEEKKKTTFCIGRKRAIVSLMSLYTKSVSMLLQKVFRLLNVLIMCLTEHDKLSNFRC